MLTEINLKDIPESQSFIKEATPDGKFAESLLLEFIDSKIMIAEVSGWPSGDPRDSKAANRYANLIRNKIDKHKIANITVLQRGNRIFIQKLIIRKGDN